MSENIEEDCLDSKTRNIDHLYDINGISTEYKNME